MKSVKLKISLAILTVTLIYTTLLAVSIISMQKINSSYHETIDLRVVIQNNMQDVFKNSQTQALAIRGHLVSEQLDNEKQFRTAKANIDQLLEESAPLLSLDEYKQLLAQMDEINQDFEAKYNVFLERINNGATQDEKYVYWEEILLPVGVELRELADKFANDAVEIMFNEADENYELASNISKYVMIISTIVFILSILFGLIISKSIAKPIITVTEAAKRVSTGDLTLEPIEVKTKDELKTLADTFNDMVNNLRNVVRIVSESSNSVAASSEELLASAEETAKSTEHITNSIQEVAVGARST